MNRKYEDTSLINRVLFYREELLSIHNGDKRVEDVFTQNESRKNKRYGVTCGGGNKRCRLTPKALSILGVKE